MKYPCSHCIHSSTQGGEDNPAKWFSRKVKKTNQLEEHPLSDGVRSMAEVNTLKKQIKNMGLELERLKNVVNRDDLRLHALECVISEKQDNTCGKEEGEPE